MEKFSYTPAQKQALALLGGSALQVMLFGGSRSGKSFAICAALAVRAIRYPGSRQAVIRRYFKAAASSIGQDTLPKVLRLRFPELEYDYQRSGGCFVFPNGSEIRLIGLDDFDRSDKILGNEFFTIYFNECSELDYASVQTALTRLAQKLPGGVNRAYFDCNPPDKRHWTFRVFIEKTNPFDGQKLAHPEHYAALKLNPQDNAVNLPADYIENTLRELPLRQKERFLEGRFADASENALWSYETISRCRCDHAPELRRVVIGVDPAVTGNSASDLTGIVGAGIGGDGRYYVLADRSCRDTPVNWMRRVIGLYRELAADLVVGESNNGGDLIEALLKSLACDVNFRAVRATRGKIVRAEPVAALYERGLVSHVGSLVELEEELTGYTGSESASSPDRLDALVWALTELMRPSCRFIPAVKTTGLIR